MKIHWKSKKNRYILKKVKFWDFCINFKIRYLSDYWSKILRRKCVGKPLTHILWKHKNFSSFLICWGFLVELRKDQKISSSFLNPSSNAAEIKGEWGRMRNFQKIEKFDSWRFERTSSEVFWTNSRWEIPIWMSVHGGPQTGPLYHKKKHPLKKTYFLVVSYPM